MHELKAQEYKDKSPPALSEAYAFCLKLAQSHYENFPVASMLVPSALRLPIATLYAFARQADDLADEGHASMEERLSALNDFELEIDKIEKGQSSNLPVFIALQDVVTQFHLPLEGFKDLLQAFKQDAKNPSYDNFEQVLAYCSLSANPVGRLLLGLMKVTDEVSLFQADKLCTALQLINFIQDLGEDLSLRQRCYLNRKDLCQFGLPNTVHELMGSKHQEALRLLCLQQLAYCQTSLKNFDD